MTRNQIHPQVQFDPRPLKRWPISNKTDRDGSDKTDLFTRHQTSGHELLENQLYYCYFSNDLPDDSELLGNVT
jgi:hypothetical protein